MMEIMKKNIILIAAALVALASCEKPAPYEPGAPMDVNGPNVYFSNYNLSAVTLASDATEFEVAVIRDDASSALSVPLKADCGYEGLFEVPATVEFASGVDSVGVVVKITDKFEMFKPYMLTLSVPEEYYHSYSAQEAYPNYTMNVLQEDYVPYKEGMYYDMFFTGAGWPVTLEYSEIQKVYRLSDVWAPLGGSSEDLTFTWEGGESPLTMGAGSYQTGLTMGKYGLVTAVVTPNAEDDWYCWYGAIPAEELYEGSPATQGFIFYFKWTVSAESFGYYPQFFVPNAE